MKKADQPTKDELRKRLSKMSLEATEQYKQLDKAAVGLLLLRPQEGEEQNMPSPIEMEEDEGSYGDLP
jgi:hypothetical protein